MNLLLCLSLQFLLATCSVIRETDDEDNTELMVLPPGLVPRASMREVFRDEFNYVDRNKWSLDASASMGWFSMYTPEQRNCYTHGGTIYLKPTLTADRFGENFLHNSVLDIKKLYGYCDPTWNNGCYRDPHKDGINPVAMSCFMRSKFSFKYGKMEIVAKMPKGDWLWPALWLFPKHGHYGEWPRSGEIDVAEITGNVNYGGLGVHRQSASLHFGNDRAHDHHIVNHKTLQGTTWGDAFHKYTLDWTSSHINIYIDGQMMLSTPMPGDGLHHHYHLPGNNIWGNSHNAPFDQDFYIIMSNGVGGGGIFPDNVRNYPHPKPWSVHDSRRDGMEKFWRHKNDWYQTWHGEDPALQVRSVVVWQY
ncbi:beta-1,3-glucan-binding protein-like [Liolophura sinensis]|uniref:beta-1,3-glucan-binding protein-like n=1 Tax=Liolophura sinensis TaxID=3198878 RepID=UPI00315883FE